MLDGCYRSFENASSSIQKLLSQPVDQDFRELVESFLHSAALVQRGALEWKLEAAYKPFLESMLAGDERRAAEKATCAAAAAVLAPGGECW